MEAFCVMLSNVMLFSFLMIPGFLLGKCGKFHRGAVTTLTNLLMYVGMPFLVLSKLMAMDVCKIAMVDLLICFSFAVGFVFVLFLIYRLLGRKESFSKEGAFCATFSNCGFMGIPLVSTMFPDQPEITVYVSLFNVFTTFMLWSFGVYILSGDRKNINLKRMAFSPVTMAILLGVLLSLTGWGRSIPLLSQYADILAGITTPLSMVVLGFQFSNMRIDGVVLQKITYQVILLKLVVHPFLAILMMKLGSILFHLSVELEIAMLIATAVPTAASAPAMAETYGADGEKAAKLTVATTLCSLVTLPLIYLLFQFV